MKTLIVTGGVATGKSTVCGLLVERAEKAVCFDADACVRTLLTSAEVVALIREEFGGAVFDDDGFLSRCRLREIVFSDSASRERLEEILHPLVKQSCLDLMAEARSGSEKLVFIADIPLYFEAAFDVPTDFVAVVATGRRTQISRIINERGLERNMAEKIIGSQWPIEKKIRRADLVLWNSGDRGPLCHQVELLLKSVLN